MTYIKSNIRKLMFSILLAFTLLAIVGYPPSWANDNREVPNTKPCSVCRADPCGECVPCGTHTSPQTHTTSSLGCGGNEVSL